MKIQIIRRVQTPTRGTSLSAGLDFFIPEDFMSHTLAPGQSVKIPSGIKVEIPKHHVLIAFNKSGVALNKNLQVGACVIDEDYQGEIHIQLFNVGNSWVVLNPGDKIVQFVLLPVCYPTVEVADTLHTVQTERGTGGFGSTNI